MRTVKPREKKWENVTKVQVGKKMRKNKTLRNSKSMKLELQHQWSKAELELALPWSRNQKLFLGFAQPYAQVRVGWWSLGWKGINLRNKNYPINIKIKKIIINAWWKGVSGTHHSLLVVARAEWFLVVGFSPDRNYGQFFFLIYRFYIYLIF